LRGRAIFGNDFAIGLQAITIELSDAVGRHVQIQKESTFVQNEGSMMIHDNIAPSRSMAAARQLARQLGRQLFGAGLMACVLALAACGGGDGAGSGGNPASGGNGSNGGNGPSTNQPLPVGAFVPLSWSSVDPATQYTLTDGTLVTRVGGRVRDRHAREQ